LGWLSLSGAGLVIVEQTAVEPAGRITHCCLGLYSDAVKPREPSGIKSGRNRWFVDSPLEGSGFELPVPRCALIANRAALVAPPAGGVGHLTRARWLTPEGSNPPFSSVGSTNFRFL